jgi:hypothetical protein
MKMTFMSSAAILLLAVSLFSCKKEAATAVTETNDSPATVLTGGRTNVQNQSIIASAEAPYWNVGSLTVNGINLTPNYNEISLQFIPDSLAMAVKEEIAVQGEWYMPATNQLHLSFPIKTTIGNLKELNENWRISRTTPKSMYLKYDYLLIHKELRLDIDPSGLGL